MQPDAGQYGRSFADVYDQWYTDGSEGPAIDFVHSMVPTGGSIYELGIGTGRLALPLAASGRAVSGMDASAEMLDMLRSKDAAGQVAAQLGDAGDPAAYPTQQFDLVLAAFNLLFNLTEDGAQQRCLTAAAQLLAPGGSLVLEAFVPVELPGPRADLVTRSVTDTQVVLIATEADPATGLIAGSHIELGDGTVRLRPWNVRVAPPAAIDEIAAAAGLELVERFEDYHRTPFVDGDSDHHVSVYRRVVQPGFGQTGSTP